MTEGKRGGNCGEVFAWRVGRTGLGTGSTAKSGSFHL